MVNDMVTNTRRAALPNRNQRSRCPSHPLHPNRPSIAALGLWLKPMQFMEMLLWMSLAGGVLTVVTLAVHHLRKAEGKPEIPYGVAIALATAPIIAERYIYHFSR
jgi:hypothetical protein